MKAQAVSDWLAGVMHMKDLREQLEGSVVLCLGPPSAGCHASLSGQLLWESPLADTRLRLGERGSHGTSSPGEYRSVWKGLSSGLVACGKCFLLARSWQTQK